MKYVIRLLLALLAVANAATAQTIHDHAPVNGLKTYYEIYGTLHGAGKPLVLLHGGGSTIASTFGRVLPELAKTHQVIAVELQAHGHTADIDRPLTFEQDADDVTALLGRLHVARADSWVSVTGARLRCRSPSATPNW